MQNTNYFYHIFNIKNPLFTVFVIPNMGIEYLISENNIVKQYLPFVR